MRNIKNKILKGLFAINVIVLMLCGCALDSVSFAPAIVCFICLIYITIFTIANTRG